MKKLNTFPFLVGVLGLAFAGGCDSASKDCEAFAKHLVELTAKEKGAPLDPELASKTIEQTTKSCEAEPPKAEAMACALKAPSTAEMIKCETGKLPEPAAAKPNPEAAQAPAKSQPQDKPAKPAEPSGEPNGGGGLGAAQGDAEPAKAGAPPVPVKGAPPAAAGEQAGVAKAAVGAGGAPKKVPAAN